MDTFAIHDLTFFYPGQAVPALDRLDLTVRSGEFWVLCGPSGCGKSTLLRQLKTVLAPHGHRLGEIRFEGVPLDELDQREQAARIGFVLQSPENQLVTDKVWHELAFGLESLGYDTPTIRRRVAEMASFFGIQTWFYKNVAELSGGQKQLLNLASVMAMQPSVLILDEPTSQLDPIAAADFLATLGKINRELGTTILLTEHRLEDAFPLAGRVAVLDRGRLLCTGTPSQVGAALKDAGHAMFQAMPAPMRIWAAVGDSSPCPVTVREGRDWLGRFAAAHPLGALPEEQRHAYPPEAAITARDLWFKYEKDLPDVVKGLSLTVRRGEFLALLGGNGTGKTTSLKLLSGLLQPCRGELETVGRLGVLPQNPQALFVKKTVREDLFELLKGRPLPRAAQEEQVARAVTLCRLEELLDRHPYDLSGGEQQRAALAKILLLEPDVLLLDEPTKGLDAGFKQTLAEILQRLLRRGVPVLMVSHDIEFCARYAHRCALFFDGTIVTEGPPRAFFSGNSFYTTAANRMARARLPGAVTAEEVIAACGGALPPEPELPEASPPLPPPGVHSADDRPGPLPWWRRLIAAVSAAAALLLLCNAVGAADLTALIGAAGASSAGMTHLKLDALLLAALLVFTLAVSRRAPPPVVPIQVPRERRRLPKRTVAAAVMILLLIPVTLFVGLFYLDNKKYYFISLLILLECMAPFFLLFEGRKPQARELVVIAVLCAVAVAGRAALFMLPQCKPVMALTILAGVAFGGEAGFLVGAMTMLLSNLLFAQGPWTPYQMFAMGIIGFLAGLLFRRGLLRRSRVSLAVFGALAAIVVYGGIMNPVSALLWSQALNGAVLLTYYLSGFPMDLIQAIATFLFLWFAAEPLLEKLERIKVKYGLME
ncbi:ECF transporter S component [Intestinimonas massiliensis (ex Afouda et al. 2020)]|uniref:ECF transporter S component n=1 Tax=Intestinimonas massiliensis (ex Afouda et al. 2020) TaxID=1673721 RepID=UPI00067E89DB|nr:ECF transporter S component [Intestinimonas massiliensis (ex Afouda et al. 2020)]